jgi:hypothetical protein
MIIALSSTLFFLSLYFWNLLLLYSFDFLFLNNFTHPHFLRLAPTRILLALFFLFGLTESWDYVVVFIFHFSLFSLLSEHVFHAFAFCNKKLKILQKFKKKKMTGLSNFNNKNNYLQYTVIFFLYICSTPKKEE